MNRKDRLLSIVLERQSKGHQRAEDLAKTLKSGTRTSIAICWCCYPFRLGTNTIVKERNDDDSRIECG